jgi:hypothetical protein
MHRILFTYPSQPGRIALANVSYQHPNKAIWSFQKPLTPQQLEKIYKLARSMSPMPIKPLLVEHQIYQNNCWHTILTTKITR